LFGKFQEALGLYARNNYLRTEVEKLKGELASRDEEMAKQKEELVQKDELFQQTKDEFTSDVADSYAAGFEDVITQVACVHPEVNRLKQNYCRWAVSGCGIAVLNFPAIALIF